VNTPLAVFLTAVAIAVGLGCVYLSVRSRSRALKGILGFIGFVMPFTAAWLAFTAYKLSGAAAEVTHFTSGETYDSMVAPGIIVFAYAAVAYVLMEKGGERR